MIHSFDSFFLFCSSLFNCYRTTVTATWKLRGLPRLAASIRLSQAAFRLLYLSETSEGKEQFLEYEDLSLSMESNKDGSHTPY
jgi:hypothetical protein